MGLEDLKTSYVLVKVDSKSNSSVIAQNSFLDK